MTQYLQYSDILAAANRIDEVAVRTPLLRFHSLNELLGADILIKAEIFQHIGAFKFRGAYNRLVQLGEVERVRDVIACSSGNHAQGVAMAAKLLGINATIVMPEDAPAIKMKNTKALGAKVRLYDRYTQSREQIVEDIAGRSGAVIVPPYDDYDIMAGQGTIGLEITSQAQEMGAKLDAVLLPCGGGGLCAGVSTALKHDHPDLDLYLVEPKDFDDAGRSLRSGTRQSIVGTPRSICDAVQTPTLGELTFPILHQNFKAGLTVTDEQVKYAMWYGWERLKMVIEPGAAMVLAAILSGQIDVQGKTIALVISGGNVDPKIFMDCLQEGRS